MAEDELTIAADGLVARNVDPWAEDKLFFVQRYMDIFSKGMKNKWPRLAYIDLFSGPGKSIVKGTGREILGSPLIALNRAYPFTHHFLNDASEVVTSALKQRVGDDSRVTFSTSDCNEAARIAGTTLFSGPDARRTLGLAFIDPTGFQISFDAISEMTHGRQIDLIITVMTGFIRRFMTELGPSLDAFFGSMNWRQLIDTREAGGAVTFRDLLNAFEDQLRRLGYQDVDDEVRFSIHATSRSITWYSPANIPVDWTSFARSAAKVHLAKRRWISSHEEPPGPRGPGGSTFALLPCCA